jgi:hypothetical protein
LKDNSISVNNFVSLNVDLDVGGLNLIIGAKFVGWVPYTRHYRDHYNTKLYLEPWNYLGYYTFPELLKQYPETSCINEANKFFEFEDPISLRDKVFVNVPRVNADAVEENFQQVEVEEKAPEVDGTKTMTEGNATSGLGKTMEKL